MEQPISPLKYIILQVIAEGGREGKIIIIPIQRKGKIDDNNIFLYMD